MIKRKYVKRRKDKYNPYNIFEVEEEKYISFVDGNGSYHKFQISKELYDVFNEFELVDLSYLNVWGNSLDERAIVELRSVEDIVIDKMQNEKLHDAILGLSDIQRRRVIL